VFSKLKSLNISALEEDRKTMAFDIPWVIDLIYIILQSPALAT
jgi:hypothetical protein